MTSNIHAEARFYTDSVGAESIKSSSAFKELKNQIPVSLETEIDISGNVFSEQHKLRNREVQRAQNKNAAIITIQPDNVFSDGAIQQIVEMFKQGYLGIYWRPLRVEGQFYGAVLLWRPKKNCSFLTLSAEEMLEIALRYYHPWAFAQFVNARNFTHFFEWLTWPIYAQEELAGMVAACPFPTDFLFFKPCQELELGSNQVIGDAKSFERVKFVEDASKGVIVSLLPKFKYVDWYADERRFNVQDSALTCIDMASSTSHCFEDRLLFYCKAGLNERDVIAAKGQAKSTMKQLRVARKLLGFRDVALSCNCNLIAEICSGIFFCDVEELIDDLAEEVTFLMPTDKLIDAQYSVLIADGDNSGILELFRSLIIKGNVTSADMVEKGIPKLPRWTNKNIPCFSLHPNASSGTCAAMRTCVI